MTLCSICKLPTSRPDDLCSPCRMGSIASECAPRPSEAQDLDASDAYGLPNDIRAAKEEIYEWRQAIEALGVMGGPSALRSKAVEMHRHHDEHHEREKRLLAELDAAREVVRDARKYGTCNGSCVTCANLGESCGSSELRKSIGAYDRAAKEEGT